MKLKLDENLGRRGQDLLRAAGHDIDTVLAEGLAGSPDERLAEVLRAEDRCLVTLDLDFANPLRFLPSRHRGLVVLRVPNPIRRADIEHALDSFLKLARQRSVVGRLWVVEVDRIREYAEEKPDDD